MYSRRSGYGRIASTIAAGSRRLFKSYSKPPSYKPKTSVKFKSATRTFTRKKGRSYQGPGLSSIKPGLTFAHGRYKKVNKAFRTKVLEAASNMNTHYFKTSLSNATAIGRSSYNAFTPLMSIVDLVAIGQAINAGAYPTTKFMVRDCTQTLLMANCSVGCVNLRVYECKARYPITSDATLTSLNDYISTGFTNGGYSNGTTDPTSTLFQSSNFVTWVKITKVRNLILAPGENLSLTLKVNNPTRINMQVVAPNADNTLLATRFSRFFVIQQWGGVINGTAANSQLTAVSLNDTKIDFVLLNRYNYQWTADTTNNINTAGTLPTVAASEFVTTAYNSVSADAQS